MIRKILLGLAAALALSAGPAVPQSCTTGGGCTPGFTFGQVPTPAQWNSYFAAKQDYLGYTPVNRSGDSMAGKLRIFGSGSSSAGLNLTPGTAPSSPVNGDVWTTTTGLFVRLNGVTIGPLLGGGGDVVGPASSTDNALARFDLATGKLLQNSTVTLGDTGVLAPTVNDGGVLGTTSLGWGDLHGATGFTWNIGGGNWAATHSSGIMTVAPGDFRVTTAGTNTASVVTVGGTQTLTNKTLTAPAISSILNVGTITLPSSTTTLVGTGTTDTLTNKTLTTPVLTLTNSSAPVPTVEGRIEWDTDDDTIVVGNGSTSTVFNSRAAQGLIYGLTCSNNVTDAANDIDMAIGEASSTAASPFTMQLNSGLTKRLDAVWAAGNNQGGRFAAAIADGTWHLFLIRNPTTGVVDYGFSFGAASPLGDPNYPAGFSQFRRVCSVVRSGGSILAFQQSGNDFRWVTPNSDVNATNPGTSAVSRTLTVPNGIVVQAQVCTTGDNVTSNQFFILLSALNETDSAPGIGLNTTVIGTNANAGMRNTGCVEIPTNTNGQIRSRQSLSGASDVLRITTYGWQDTRGQYN